MTPIFFVCVYALGMLLTLFKHPRYGVYTYLFTFYMSPSHSWWADELPDLRYQLIIGAVTAVITFSSPITDPSRPKWLSHRSSQLLLALVGWMWVQYFWAVDQELHLEGTIEFSKHLLIYSVIYRLFDTEEKVRNFLLVHIVGCMWFGYLALGASSGRLESIGGPVGGANELGQHVTTALIAGGIMWMYLKGWSRLVIFAALPLILNTIILTVSRGAFLGFFVAGMISGIFIPRIFRIQFILLSALAIVLLILLAHDALIDRFVTTWEALTTETQELDGSATSRVHIFDAGMKIGQDYPFGSGYRGTAVLSPHYMDNRYLVGSTGRRSAHNTFAAVFAEHGYPGAVIYVLLVLWVIMTLFRVRQLDSLKVHDRALLVALIAAVLGMYVSGLFSNNLFTETQYWYLALICTQLARAKQTNTTSAQTNNVSPRDIHTSPLVP